LAAVVCLAGGDGSPHCLWLLGVASRCCFCVYIDMACAGLLALFFAVFCCFLLLLSLAHVLHSLLLWGFALPLCRKKLLTRAIGVCSCFVGSLETVLAWLCAIAII
jgi:hypothetical protein